MYEDLISELRKVFPEIDCNHCPVNRNCWGLKGVCTFEKAADAIEVLSKERKIGKWKNYIDDGYLECQFCGAATNCDGDIEELHFCFSCGARLEE